MRPLLLLLLLSFALTACGGTAAQRRSDVDDAASGAAAATPDEADADPPPKVPPAPAASAFPNLPPPPETPTPPLDGDVRASLLSWQNELGNAARRDRELEGLVRGYLMIARQIFVHFRGARTGPGEQGDYDPMPSWRFQARTAPQLLALSARAAMLSESLGRFRESVGASEVRVDLGERSGLPIEATPDGGTRRSRREPERDRAAMIALYQALCACVREDAWHRAQHGAGLIRRQRAGQEGLERAERGEMMRREVAMLRTTMRCTSLAGRRRPMRDD